MPISRLSRILQSLVLREDGRCEAEFGGLRLFSHFQPIYSLSHSRVVGHEALLRATDAQGAQVPPLTVFDRCRTQDEARWCDSLSRGVHLKNFMAQAHGGQWVFLNVQPQAIIDLTLQDRGTYMAGVRQELAIPSAQIVLELLESELPADDGVFLEALAAVRAHGLLIALDDFGAGHSNFDRVWKVRPDIVKLDRSLLASVDADPSRQRVIAQMVSLLHECGSLVLMEGIETEAEAMLALESDVDFVQGYYFGRPQPALCTTSAEDARILALHARLAAFRQQRQVQQKALVSPYQNAIGYAGALLSAGRPLEEACRAFLELPHAELCFVLDEQGYQTGDNLRGPQSSAVPLKDYGPLRHWQGACWARRPYFRRALQMPGKVQVTRPYRTLNGNRLTITVSYAFLRQQEEGPASWQVICGDVTWDEGGRGLWSSAEARVVSTQPA